MAAPNRCWSDLPVEMLCSIQKHLPLADYLRFGAVCRSWCFAAKLRLHRPAAGPPWFMLPEPRGDGDSAVVRFISSNDKTYSFPLPVEDFYSRRFLGSSSGWLITLDQTPKLHLLNPLTGAQFQLPPFAISRIDIRGCEMFWDEFRRGFQYTIDDLSLLFGKTILTVPAGGSTATLDCGYTVATIRATGGSDSACVAVTGNGIEGWTLLNPVQFPYRDIIFYNGFLCAVTDSASVLVWDLSAGPTPEPESFILPPRGLLMGLREEDQLYLAESSGDLLLVAVAGDDVFDQSPPAPATCAYWIYKLDLGGRREWKEVRSLGERALFVGVRMESTSFSARGFPSLMENCLYLRDVFPARLLDPGVTTTPHTMAYSSVCSSLNLDYAAPPWFRIVDCSPPLLFTPSVC